ncbi:TIGR02221 family CRISPR-associated protein [Herpetosiphon sp. NSE202]|uniref:TIGR02221 family CRISPR-associated protein n=1 Tax=Herpetosiphon sp. NSE202 TaxID=3351349 RepID=UPI0036333F03
MRKLISFLGANPPSNNYKRTIYKYGQLEHESLYATAAMAKIFNSDQVYVFVTPQAKFNNFDLLTQHMNEANLTEPIACDIPIGENNTEIWQIFNAITNTLQDGDTIIFDITNGLRSLPILGFIACAYITSVRKVTIEHLVYGAFEVKKDIMLSDGDPATESPVFDLTPFLTLLDWTTATNTFIQTGRAEQLTKLAETFKNDAVEGFAKQVHKLSQELLTTRPVGVIQAASGFEQALAKVEAAVQQNPAMQPYQQLLERIKDEYSPFAIATDPLADLTEAYRQARSDQQGFLRIQIKMIRQYLDKGLPIQAMTLAREWLVSLGVYHQGSHDIFNYKDREVIARMLNQNSWSEDPRPTETLQPHLKQIREVWSGITLDPNDKTEATNHVRNDIAHCGMTPVFIKNGRKQLNVRTAADIIDQTIKICDRLESLLATIV